MNDINKEWNNFTKNVVRPVWDIYHRKYEMLGLEYGDFENIAYIILEKELKKYKPSKSGVYTYSINVLKRRMGDYIRNNYETDKTRANFCPQSLNVPVADDIDLEIEDTLQANKEEKQESNITKIKKFIKTLSNKQKEILLLSIIGLDEGEIQSVMEISSTEYDEILRKLRSPRRTSILKYERNEVV